MKICRTVLPILLIVAILAYARGNEFDMIRYNGGTLKTDVSPKDWGNRLTVTSGEIMLELKDGQKITVDPKRVTTLSYGQEAHRRVGTMVALGILVAPLTLFGLFHKTRLHFVGIEYTTADGKRAGLLLQAHKNNYRAVLMALRGVTGAPVAVAEEDRKYVPTGVEAAIAESSGRVSSQAVLSPSAQPATTAPLATQPVVTPAPSSPVASEDLCTVLLKSAPEGADIYLDGKFVGNTPSTVRLPPGDHIVTIEKPGFKQWLRNLTVIPGASITIDATLEKAP